ncbi:mitochondrial carrier domain-containing protein [Chytriomyces sp. MP71]|nr:mitochondrial carrier domain-containing protein [Chytriomyces sp. MP71]
MVDWSLPLIIALSNALAVWEIDPTISHATSYVSASSEAVEPVPRLPPSLSLSSQPLHRWRDASYRARWEAGLEPGQDPSGVSGSSAVTAVVASSTTQTQQHFSVAKFSAVCASAVLSRTATAPLERLKVVQQTALRPISMRATFRLLRQGDSWLQTLFRGNGLNAMRAVPLSAVQFLTFDATRGLLTSASISDPVSVAVAAAFAGIVSVTATYPLDLLRTRISLMHAKKPAVDIDPSSPLRYPVLSVMRTARQIVTHEGGGFFALYRGLGLSLVGIAPYMSLSLILYEAVKPHQGPGTTAVASGGLASYENIFAASLATAASQTATYPFEVVRRKLQVEGLRVLEVATAHAEATGEPIPKMKTRSAWRVLHELVNKEGYKGAFRGLLPNLIKVFPATLVSLYVHELWNQ